MAVVVTLTETQIKQCETVAKNRTEIGGKIDFNHDRMTPEYKRKIELLGAKGELAVSLYTGLPWTGSSGPHVSDVDGYEVRTTQRKDSKNYYLYVRAKDKESVYIFCVVDGSQVVIAGWSTAAEVRTKGCLMFEDTQCYGLPRKDLYPMETLR